MKWRTKVTELLGCTYPILQGAFHGFGKAEFAAAVSNAGAFGCITAGSYRTPEKVRESIRKYRELSEEPFSVNLTIGGVQDEDRVLDAILDEGVRVVETAAYVADKHGKRVKEAGGVWIHKTATLRHALHAEAAGADALIIVGLEGIGKKNISQLTTMTTLFWAEKFLKVPLIIAGGIGDARGFLSALAAGADGIMMGTRFMAIKECPIADRIKEKMVSTPPDDINLKYICLNMPDPKEHDEVMKRKDEVPLEKWLMEHTGVMLKGRDWKGAGAVYEMEEGETRQQSERASGLYSMAVGAIDSIPTAQELIDSIVHGAEDLLDSYEFLKSWASSSRD